MSQIVQQTGTRCYKKYGSHIQVTPAENRKSNISYFEAFITLQQDFHFQ